MFKKCKLRNGKWTIQKFLCVFISGYQFHYRPHQDELRMTLKLFANILYKPALIDRFGIIEKFIIKSPAYSAGL